MNDFINVSKLFFFPPFQTNSEWFEPVTQWFVSGIANQSTTAIDVQRTLVKS